MDCFEIFDGFEKIEHRLETSPSMADCTLLGIKIDENKIDVEFCDIQNLENQKMCFSFFDAKCTFLNFSNEFPMQNYSVWNVKVGQAKNGELKFSVWDANGNSVGFPLLLEIEFKNAKVELQPYGKQKEREFFGTVYKAFKKYDSPN